jgi:hypothetical protein
MPDTLTREDRISDAFLVIGSQYYVLARYSAGQFYLPVSVTLFHHAVEMLLKGYLSKRMTLAELKRIGHDLVTLWNRFMSDANAKELSRFDTTISHLDRVEMLRYPESMVDDGFALNVRIGTPIPLVLPGTEELPSYSVDVSDLDEIATAIFKACNVPVTPYFRDAPLH